MIYLCIFAISLLFVSLASKNKANKVIFWLFSLIAVLLPVLLATFRNIGIGTDTMTYVNDVFSHVNKVDSLSKLIDMQMAESFGEIEMGYVLLNYIASFLGDTSYSIYFVTSFTFLFTVYCCIVSNNKRYMLLSWFIFLFFFYNFSLNVVRQTIAIGFTLAAFSSLEKKRYTAMLLFSVLTWLCHGTGMMVVIVLFCSCLIPSLLRRFSIKKVMYWVLVVSLVVIISVNTIFKFILGNQLFSGRYSNYLIVAQNKDAGALQTTFILVYIFILYLFFLAYKCSKSIKDKTEIVYYSLMHYVGMLLCLSSLITYFAFRMSYYFLVVSLVLFVPRALGKIKNSSYMHYKFILGCFVAVIIALWSYNIVYKGMEQTIPYKSQYIDSIF